MKLFNLVFVLGMLLSLASCGGDDDICESGLSSPRMKLKFKDSSNKLYQPDTLIIGVKLTGEENIKTVVSALKPDSVLVPLRVDDTNFTDLYISTSTKGTPSKVRVLYTPVSEYVSPACGMRRLYNDLSAVLENATPVKNIELNEKNVHDENKTHLYLIF